MGTFPIDKMFINAVMTILVARYRSGAVLNQKTIIRFLKQEGNTTAAAMIAAIPKDQWTDVAALGRKMA